MLTFWDVVDNFFGWNWWFLGTSCKGVKVIVNCKLWPIEKMLQRRFHILWITLGMISSWAFIKVKFYETHKRDDIESKTCNSNHALTTNEHARCNSHSWLSNACDDQSSSFNNHCLLHIVKDVVVVFREAFSRDLSIHPSHHPSMDGIIQGRKP
jgi:hypothetical protein